MNESQQMETVNAFWVGPKLGPIHASCIRSFVRHGYRMVLHAFDEPEDLPDGIELFDASQLMKRSEIVRHSPTGSLTLASDIYRLRILREGMGLYVDCDVYCLKPFPGSDHIFGWDHEGLLNTAVLNIPATSQLLRKMLSAAEDPYFIPPWEKRQRQIRMRVWKSLGFPKPVSKQPWGTIGPNALTYYTREVGLDHLAAPIDFFYPMFGLHRPLLYDTGLSLRDLITSRSYALHLCSSGMKSDAIPKNTPLGEIVYS